MERSLFLRINNAAMWLEFEKPRSAWGRGVLQYAHKLLGNYAEFCSHDWQNAPEFCEKTLLNGAANWLQYSEGGFGLCYNSSIAERLCNPSELRRHDCGAKNPNSHDSRLQVEARALSQAWQLLLRAWAAAE